MVLVAALLAVVIIVFPRDEAFALSRNPEDATLTDVALTLDELSVQMQGQVPTALFGNNPEAVLADPENGIRSVSYDLAGSSFAPPEETGSIDLTNPSFAADGDLRFAALAEANREGDYGSLLQHPCCSSSLSLVWF